MVPLLNYRILGQGKPVIILHGLFGMLDNWMNIAKKLENEGYMAILIDQRDHGRSEHTDAFDYPTLAEDLLHFMDENWIHEAILIGHSMGGKTGLQFVSQHESMISKFIVIDIGIKQYEPGHHDVFEALFTIDLDKIQSRDEAEQTMMKTLDDRGTVQFLMKNLTRKKEGGFEWKMNLSLLHRHYKNILGKISFDHLCHTRTLFIRGDKSDYILDHDIPDILASLPEARFVTIQDAGHWVHADKPIELFDEIIHFIRD